MAFELVIVGAGISGLTAALKAHKNGLDDVLIIEYEKYKGGIAVLLQHTDEFQKERLILNASESLPYDIWYQSTVTGFIPGDVDEPHQLFVQTTSGTQVVEATNVLLSTGSLEKPREGQRIAGTRPAGVMTPTMALNLLNRNYQLGEKIVIYDNSRITRAISKYLTQLRYQIEVLPAQNWDIYQINGISRIEQMIVKNRSTGALDSLKCDTLIYANNRIPSTFYLKGSPVQLDLQNAIQIDNQGKANIANVFATGACTNLGHDDHSNSIKLSEQITSSMLKGMKKTS